MPNEDLVTKLKDLAKQILKERDAANKERDKYFEPTSNLEIHLRALFQGMGFAYQMVLYKLFDIPELHDIFKKHKGSSNERYEPIQLDDERRDNYDQKKP